MKQRKKIDFIYKSGSHVLNIFFWMIPGLIERYSAKDHEYYNSQNA